MIFILDMNIIKPHLIFFLKAALIFSGNNNDKDHVIG